VPDTGVIYLDVAIGVAVAFFLLSLLPSGINEAVAFVTRVRSKFLWAYLNQLFTAAAPSGSDGEQTGDQAADSAAAKARRFVPLAPAPATAATDAGGTSERGATRRATVRMARSVGAPSAAASIGLPATSWEMLGLMRAAGTRDPRPTLGGGVLVDETRRWRRSPRHPAAGPDADDGVLPVVAELHRRLGPIAVAANAGVATGTKGDKPTTTKHVPSRSLALAVVDLLAASGATHAPMAATLDGLAGTPIHSTMAALWTSAAGDLEAFVDELETWFDAEMARLSGLYKRLMRWVLGAAAVVVALLVNVDPVGLTKDLWRDPDRRAELVAVAGSGAAREAGATAGRGEPTVAPELAALYAACRPDPPPGAPTTASGDDVAAAAAAVERLRTCVADALQTERGAGLLSHAVWEPDRFAGTWGWSWDLAVLHVGKVALVAAAIFFGAPFWWDVVRRLMGIRTSVVKAET
jgi:hypothetical protein